MAPVTPLVAVAETVAVVPVDVAAFVLRSAAAVVPAVVFVPV